MRRMPALLALPVILGLALSGCVPTAFDPRTGAGYEEMRSSFAALSDEEQLAEIARGDARTERALWTLGGLEDALGGAAAADEVFDTLIAQVTSTREAAEPANAGFVLAAVRDDVAEAKGAGAFAGMLVSRLMAEVGISLTKDGTTGDAVRDFGGKDGTARATVSAPPGGGVATTLEMNTTYKGVSIQIKVGTDIDPCPDARGVIEPTGTYQVNVTGPDGTGSSTQVDVAMNIQLDDEARIATSSYTYEAAYSARPQTPGTVFDFTTRSVTFSRDAAGKHHTEELNAAGFWDEEFLAEAGRVGEFFALWVTWSIEAAAQKGWEDGRCIELAVTPSAGPTGLDPGDVVSVLAQPIAKQDATPAGGTVVATLTGGEYAIGPEGEKVPADATFSYQAPRAIDEEGTVHFESRSRRGVGMADVTFDTRAQHYAISGGSGVFAGTGEWCAGAQAFSTIGGDVTTFYQLDGADGGSVQYSGGNMTGGWAGGGSFSVERRDGIPVALRVTYAGQFYALNGAVLPHSETMTFSVTPKDSCDNA